MPTITLEISPELQARMSDWSNKMNLPPENLAVELLDEYFDDCDDADRLETLIRNGEMKTYSADSVHRELENCANVGS